MRESMLRRLALLAAICAPMATSAQAVDTSRALSAMREFRDACARDGGRLWSRSMCGPVALVHRPTRLVIANDTVAGRGYLRLGEAYVTTLPSAVNAFANTSFAWDGRRWAMVLLPLEGDAFDRTRLLVHESFHREQDSLHLGASDPASYHLDELEGRRWFRLELRALSAAVESLPDSAAARRHAAAAMIFRARRRMIYPAADTLEPALEVQEGLAEYTAVRLALASTGAPLNRVTALLRSREQEGTLVRSFAYASGPAIGLLLDRFDPSWRSRVVDRRDPGRMLGEALGIRLSPSDLTREAARAAARYGGDVILAEERVRDSVHQARLAPYRARLIEGPVLHLPTATGLSRVFNPNELIAVDASATVYPTGTLGGEWGSLEVTGGALVANDQTWIRVSAPAVVPPDAGSISGPGWTLTLKPGWIVKPAERAGSFVVARAR